ncbi:MAG: homoserine O-succinyltransferase [Hyphomicrobiales bacterium]
MPIKIQDELPAVAALAAEGVELIGNSAAFKQDIRPMRIALLNLMPTKTATELQIARLLGHTPLQIELVLLTTSSYTPKNTSSAHLETFYRTIEDVKGEYFDGLIITGAPVEQLNFEDVAYWPEFLEIMDWADAHVLRRLHICWGAQAGLHRTFGIAKHRLPKKLSGIYRQRNLAPDAPLLRGFPAEFPVPVSRHTSVRAAEVSRHERLRILAGSRRTGPSIVEDRATGDAFIFDHMEYDTDTLGDEYRRDSSRGLAPAIPWRYFPGGDITRQPPNTWRPFGYLFLGTFLQLLYRDTPYAIDEVGLARAALMRRWRSGRVEA